MSRKHNTSVDSGEFNLTINDDGTWPVDRIQAALLADIRRELLALNRLLNCRNFITLPAELRGLRRDLKTKRKKK